MIKARKIIIVTIDENNVIYQKEAVEFYDENTNDNVDPAKTDLTQEEIIKMTNDAFNGN
ncbi:hypothetical protein [Pantoea ananatis]|uniref:hypothetical protein n=1 Tax=Pantoea ananas TaxID=553 RepID=UPI001B311992|nr:hypothetical protein [Pantoea ananatis]